MKQQEKIKTKTVVKKSEVGGAKKALWERRFFIETLIFGFCFLLFANTIPNNYNLDDELVTINHRLTSKGISAIPEIFASPYYEDESGYSYEYRPVVLASFAIEHDLFGESPHWGHFWNIILYALSCVVLYRLLLLMFYDYSYLFSLAIALLFAAHTAHTEAICSIKNRDEILGMLFSFLALGFTVRAIFSRKYLLLAFTPLFFALSLLSKLSFIPFVFIIPLTVLFFCEVSFIPFLYIIASLSVPPLFLLHFSGYFKLELIIAMVGLFSILYFIMFPDWRQLLILRIKETYHKTGGIGLPASRKNNTDSTTFFQSILPKSDLLSWQPMLLSLTAIGCFIAGASFSILPLLITGLVVTTAMLIVKNSKAQWFGTFSLCVIVVYSFIHFPALVALPIVSIASLPFLYLLLRGDRTLFIPLFFATVTLVYLGESHNDETIISLLPFFFILFLPGYRRGFIIALSIALLDGFVLIRASRHSAYMLLELIPVALSFILLFAIWIRQWGSLVAHLTLLLLVVLAISHQSPNQNHISIKQTADKLNPVINIKQENRPVLYVEDVVTQTDPLTVRVGTSLEILFHYLYKVILPYPLSFYYGYQFITRMSMTDGIALLSLLIHLVLIILGLFYWNKNPVLSFSIWLYLISISAFANFFQPVAGMLADRFLLVPSLGWCIILVLLIAKIARFSPLDKQLSLKSVPKSAKYLFATVLLCYSVLTFSRDLDWHDHLRLFRHDINYVDNSSQAHNLLALRLMKNSFEISDPREQSAMHLEALGHFKKAIALYPDFFNATYDIGRTYSTLNEPDSALVYYEKAALLDSTFINAYLSAGEILMQQNKFDEAKPFFEHSINFAPTLYIAYDRLSYIYFIRKDYTKSLEINKQAMSNIPADPAPCINVGKTFRITGQEDSARLYFQKALEINPASDVAKNLLSAQPATH